MSGIQQLLLGGSPAGYQIERSLRFNSADSAYLNRTPASAGNANTWTWSGWVKRSALGSVQVLFSAATDTNNFEYFRFESTDELFYTRYVGGAQQDGLTTTAVFRDPSAWYHIVVVRNGATRTIYVNNVSMASGGSNASTGEINQVKAHSIGRRQETASQYFSGYMTETYMIDGQALTPSSFGQSDPNTGVWSPIKYTGTYGTNGFYLNFSDNSNTTAATLGKDYSGNGNNWTPNNFSVTAGVGNDSLVDTPTNYGTDTGAGGEVRGNYATWNPLENGSATFVQGNLRVTTSTTSGKRSVGSTILVSSGSWYTEVECVTNGSSSAAIGIANTSFVIGSEIGANCYAYYNDGMKIINGSYSSYGASYTNGDIIGIAFDATNGTITFYKNGSSQGQITSIPAGTYRIAVAGNSSTTASTFEANFGQRPFAYTAPSGFKALCTQNLPTPTIGATSTTQANDYFNVVTYTGTGTTNAITGVGFNPDFLWIKTRSNAVSHALYNKITGVTKFLTSNTTAAESTSLDNRDLLSFDADGFTVGQQDHQRTNENTYTYVAWNWKANGAGSSNTAGTITSTVSANTTAGFSIVTYTGTGANATVGHGLGVAPSMVIYKNRDALQNWMVATTVIDGSNDYLFLNTTAAKGDSADSAPTSTLLNLTTYGHNNGASQKIVAYCFAAVAGYSAFGSYTGNGSTDGPFIFTGFRPRFVFWKNTSTTGDWQMKDAARSTYNVTSANLYANLSNAENSAGDVDFLSNGFKLRSAGTDVNGSGNTIIYAAFCESPFKFSLAR